MGALSRPRASLSLGAECAIIAIMSKSNYASRGQRISNAAALFVVAACLSMYPVLALPAEWKTYTGVTFSISYPPGFTVNATLQTLGPGKGVHGVSFTIPAKLAAGTNLESDTYLSVETLAGASICSTAPFLSHPENTKDLTQDGIRYSMAVHSEAAMGNVYEETVYAERDSSPCVAIHYFIHSSNIGNYDPGTVRAFDRTALLRIFDEMRRTFALTHAK